MPVGLTVCDRFAVAHTIALEFSIDDADGKRAVDSRPVSVADTDTVPFSIGYADASAHCEQYKVSGRVSVN